MRRKTEKPPEPWMRGWVRVHRYNINDVPFPCGGVREGRAQAEGHALRVWLEAMPEGAPPLPHVFGRGWDEGWRWSLDGEGPAVYYSQMEEAHAALAAVWRALGERVGAREPGELDPTAFGDR